MDGLGRIELLGQFRVIVGGRVVDLFRTRQTASLLAFLAYFRDRAHSRDALADRFWPDADPAAARHRLSVALSSLRPLLRLPELPDRAVLLATRDRVQLNPSLVTTDVTAFQDALRDAAAASTDMARIAALTRAAAAYTGELLPDLTEDWVLEQRGWLAERYFGVLRDMVALLEAAGEVAGALEWAQRAVGADPLREEAQREAMRLLAALGRFEAALGQYRELQGLLQRELGGAPSAATRALARRIEAAAAEGASPATHTLSPQAACRECPFVVPVPPTPLIGREEELARAAAFLRQSQVRLVTLTGPGGSGKTRLALQAAVELRASFPDGLFFVDLAPLREPELVAAAIAHTLGVRESRGQSLREAIQQFLREKRLLLLLDNFEHLLEAAPLVAELLAAALGLRVLVTSRASLRLQGEHELPVPPLAVPPERRAAAGRSVASYPAVALFVQCATASRPEFTLTEQNGEVVAAICRRLDGLPLAIELAAARVKALTVAQIAARLDDRFRLLVRGSRTAVPRHQTLRALIDWSYDLLSQAERTLLRRLSVFSGGWTLEAAEIVCADAGIEGGEVLNLLTSLVEQSLVVYEEKDGEARYRFLETVRQYARDRLAETGEAREARARHRDYFLRLAERAEPELIGPEQTAWFDRLESEHDNLRAALDWCRTSENGGEAGLRLASALRHFWVVRGHWQEGFGWATAFLKEVGQSVRTVARVKALCTAADLAGEFCHDNTVDIIALAQESLTLSRELGYRSGIAQSLMALGWQAYSRGDYDRAATLYEESRALFQVLGEKHGVIESLKILSGVALYQQDIKRSVALCEEILALSSEIGNPRSRTFSLFHLGLEAYREGNTERAMAMLEESLAVSRVLGDKQSIGYSLRALGRMAELRGDHEQAAVLGEERLALYRRLGETIGIADSLMRLGQLAQSQSDSGRALALLRESLALLRDNLSYLREVGNKTLYIAGCLEGLAMVAAARQHPERAACLFGAAASMRPDRGTPMTTRNLMAFGPVGYEAAVAAARATLGEEAFAAAWATGQAMSIEEAIAFALEENDASTADERVEPHR